MPDFFSRLVKRTFGLMTVAQPATNSIFDPGLSEKSDYLQGLASNNEPATNQDGISIDGSRKTRTISQYDNRPALNREKSFNKYDMKSHDLIREQDILRDSTSVSELPNNIESFEQSNLDYTESIESISLQARSGQYNRDFHTPSSKLIQDDNLFYKTGSYTLKSIEPETLHSENRGDRNTLSSIPKIMLIEEQFDKNEQNSQEHIEPSQNDFRDIRENTNTLVPIIRQSYDKKQAQSTGTISLKQTEPESSYSVGLQENQDISLSTASELELTYESFSVPEPSNKNSGENSSGKNKPSVNGLDSLAGESLLQNVSGSSHKSLGSSNLIGNEIILQDIEQVSKKNFNQSGHLHSGAGSFPMAPGRQNLKRMSESTYETSSIDNLSDRENSGKSFSGENKPSIESLHSRAGKSLPNNLSDSSLKSVSQSGLLGNEIILQNKEPVSKKDFNLPEHLNSDFGSSSVTPGGQNLKSITNPKVNTIPGQMENILTEQHAVARRFPPAIPTIKVTIGHIEVRAVEPPRSPQPQAPPPPKQYPILSLDDYLKQSNG